MDEKDVFSGDEWDREPCNEDPLLYPVREGEAVHEQPATETGEARPAASRGPDPIRRYFREMGRVQPLSRAEEIGVAQRLEAGRRQVAGVIVRYPLLVKRVIGLEEKLRRGESKVAEAVVPEDDEDQSPGDGDEFCSLCAFMDELAELARTVISTVTPREEQVLRRRFGIGDQEEHTLQEVGDELGLTRERIRQIEAAALAKLRHPRRRKSLGSG